MSAMRGARLSEMTRIKNAMPVAYLTTCGDRYDGDDDDYDDVVRASDERRCSNIR